LDEELAGVAQHWGTVDAVREGIGVQAHRSDDEMARWLAKMQRSFCGPATAVEYTRFYFECDVRAVLPALRIPTLVFDADPQAEDWDGMAAATAALIPGAQYRRVPGPTWLWDDAEHRLEIIRDFLGIQRRASVLDRVLATVMFTDIVDSTVTAARVGDSEWHRILDAHDRIASEAVGRYRGRVVKSTGDGILATFDGPARAVFAAREIAERVGPLGLQVRAGAHTGEIELGERDLAGIAVHVAARVAATAGPSEVWVSSTVKDLTAGSGLAFEDAGEHELKGVPDRRHLYRVVGS
jgi:class 3 adenylate cyclase